MSEQLHQPLPPVEADPAAIDPAVQAAIDAENDQRLAEHEYDLAQIREEEGRKAIEAGVHDIAYTAELHRLANNPSHLTGEHGLSGYDEMEHRAREAGRQAVEGHRARTAEIRAAADAEYERVRDFEQAYAADRWEDVVIALDKMAAYAEKTDDWTEFDKYHDQLRMVERAAYLRHHDAQHPSEEPTPAPAAPEGGNDPEPAAPAAATPAEPTETVPGRSDGSAEAGPADDDFMVMADATREGPDPEPATRRVPEWSAADHERVAPAPREGEPARRAVPSWLTGEDDPEAPYRRPAREADDLHPALVPLRPGERWRTDDEADRTRVPNRTPEEGVLPDDADLPASPLEHADTGLPAQEVWQPAVREEREVTFGDRWSGVTDEAGRVPGWKIKWRPKWYKEWKAKRAAEAEYADDERLEGEEHVHAMDQRDDEEAAHELYRRPARPAAVVEERDVAFRGAAHHVDPRAERRHRDPRELRDLLRDLDE